MRRILILSFCLILCVGLAVSASAVSYGWEDYAISHGTYPDGTSWANCEFPSDMGRFNFYNGNTFLEGKIGGNVYYSWPAGHVPRFRYLPLGQQGTTAPGVGKLVLRDRYGNNTYGIPNGTELRLQLKLTNDAQSFANFSVVFSVCYYDANEFFVSEDIVEQQLRGSFPLNFDIYYVVDAPSNADYVAFYVDIRSNVTLSSALNNVGIHASKFSMFGEGLVYHDWKVSLDDIKDGLYNKFDPINPDDLGPDALPGFEEDGRENFKDSVNNVNGFYSQVLDGLTNFTQGFLFLSALMNACLDIFALKWLVFFSASVGFACMILGITPQLVSSRDRQEERRIRALRETYRNYGRSRHDS